MRRGQTTLEYVLLIGIAAAGIIAVIVYVSRGHQGNLRSQADQLSIEQYAPGKTTVNNSQSKNLASIATSTSSTTVKYGNMNQPNKVYEDLLIDIIYKWSEIYSYRQEWEEKAVSEGIDGAVWVRQNGLPWNPTSSPTLKWYTDKLEALDGELDDLIDAAMKAKGRWPKRTKDQSSSSSYSSETGTITTHKDTSETLGDL